MTGGQAWIGLTALFLTLVSPLQAREIWTEGVPDPYFEHFLDFYKADPSAMSRWASGLRNIPPISSIVPSRRWIPPSLPTSTPWR